MENYFQLVENARGRSASGLYSHEIYVAPMRIDYQTDSPELTESDADKMFEIFVNDMRDYFNQWKNDHFEVV